MGVSTSITINSINSLKEEQQQLMGAPGVVLLWIEEVGQSQGAPRPTSSLDLLKEEA